MFSTFDTPIVTKKRSMAFAGLVAATLALAGCDKKAAAPAMPPPTVGVVTLKTQTVNLTTDLPGRTVAYRVAEIRPQVSGVILHRLFEEGKEVKAGQQLYQIDPALYKASLETAQATLAHDLAQQRTDELMVQRYGPLVKTRAISQQAYDNAVATLLQDKANVKSAQASVTTANINLVYTKLLSPISGITGRSTVTEGALVTSDQTDSLVTVQQIDPIYVDMTQSSADLLRLQDAMHQGTVTAPKDPPVSLQLEDGSTYPLQGTLQFSEVTVDQTTGSYTLRAVFKNPDKRLLPGMFVHAKLVTGVDDQGLLVPQQGVTRSQRGTPTALVLNDQNKVELRNITTGEAIGNKWLVTSGLKAGDRVIISGLQYVQPGATAKPIDDSAQQASGAAQQTAQAQ